MLTRLFIFIVTLVAVFTNVHAQSNNATLSALVLSTGTLSPAFASATLNYTTSVPNAVSSLTVTPTRSDGTATVTVNGAAAATPVALNVGVNSITLLVTAQNGTTTKNYTITVTRLPLAATFNSTGDVPVTANGYTASGNTVSITLNFAPPVGATLTVVRNTGLAFIDGTFSNLLQGQAVALTYNGITYNFVANYFGGTGNDLVLQWANTRPAAWGNNAYGQLGNGSTTNGLVPVAVNQSGVLAGKTVISVMAGYHHSIVLCSDGTLAAWGYNNAGQLGSNSTASSSVPVGVTQNGMLSGKTVISLAAGEYHTVVLCSDGTLASWGYNYTGQLGNSSTVNSTVPVGVTQSGALAGKTVISVAAGESHTVALCSDGTLAAWGYNGSGQLGNGSTTNSSAPVAVTLTGVLAGKTVISVAAGEDHTVALCLDGTLVAWGNNGWGQLGNSSRTGSLVPVVVNQSGILAGKSVISIRAARYHTVALCSDGTLAAWGNNQLGQLGNNSTTDSVVPVAVNQSGVLAAKTPVSVAAGGSHVVALCSNGMPAAWGYNAFGELGNNSTNNSLVPVAVIQSGLLAGKNVVALAAGLDHSIALVAAGSNANLSALTLSNGTLSPTFAPATLSYTMSVPNAVSSLTVTPTSADDTATVTVNGAATTTPVALSGGVNMITVLVTAQDGTTTKTYTITATRQALAATFDSASDVPLIANGYTASGGTATFALNFAPPAGTNLTVVKNTGLAFINGTFSNLGQGQAVALTYNGVSYNFVANYFGGTGNDLVLQWANVRPVAWGNNGAGELGNNSTASSSVPVAVTQSGALAGKTVISVATGYLNTLALCSDGKLAAWGDNRHGQLGNNSTTNSLVPVAVTLSGALAGKTVISVAAGYDHTVALCSDGTLAAWGDNRLGQFGNNSTTNSLVPVAVTKSGALAGKTVISLSAGGYYTLALCSDGTLAAWGDNNYGELGNSSTTSSSVPVAVTRTGGLAGKTVISVAAGGYHALALCSDGTLAAWGGNTGGQLGNNGATNSSVPVAVTRTGVLAGKTVISVAAGTYYTIALCSDGTLAAWGVNSSGVLGNNSTANSAVPVAVTQGGVLVNKAVVSVAAGFGHTMALCSDGTLAAWGGNGAGQLGNNSTTSSSVPVAVTRNGVLADKTVVSMAAGTAHTVMLVASPPAPVVTTVVATSITSSGVTLNGSINAAGGSATVYFDYGTTTGYGATVAGTPTPIIGGDLTAASATLSGLPPGTTYHFRVNAVSSGGTTYGTDQSFTTTSTNASLSALTLSNGTLSPPFSSATLSYTTSVPNAVSSLIITPTRSDDTATVTVNGTAVAMPVALSIGINTITVLVTAQDGATINTYTISVTRQTAYATWAATQGLVPTEADPAFDADGDGIPNLLEFVLGGVPLLADVSIRPSFVRAPGGTSLVFTYRRKLAAASITQTVQYTNDLTAGWTNANGAIGVTIITTLVDAQTEQVTVTLPVTDDKVFARLSVNL